MPTKKLTHITETYRDGEGRRLIRVEAYYRNDTPTGVGVVIEGIEGGELTLFDELMRDYEEAWARANASVREHIVETTSNS